jgi:peptidoglycan/LPS O-acetylase OafA/YrhL
MNLTFSKKFTFNSEIDESLSTMLHLIRALAAFIVVFTHYRSHFFLPYQELALESKNIFNFILFYISKMGGKAVIVFFILSGYLVGGNFVSDIIKNRINFKKYFVSRVVRMYVVLIPALIIGGALDIFTLKLRGISDLQNHVNLGNILGNLFFLQTIFVGTYILNSPLWSIAF